jgi:hypothetical protein
MPEGGADEASGAYYLVEEVLTVWVAIEVWHSIVDSMKSVVLGGL